MVSKEYTQDTTAMLLFKDDMWALVFAPQKDIDYAPAEISGAWSIVKLPPDLVYMSIKALRISVVGSEFNAGNRLLEVQHIGLGRAQRLYKVSEEDYLLLRELGHISGERSSLGPTTEVVPMIVQTKEPAQSPESAPLSVMCCTILADARLVLDLCLDEEVVADPKDVCVNKILSEGSAHTIVLTYAGQRYQIRLHDSLRFYALLGYLYANAVMELRDVPTLSEPKWENTLVTFKQGDLEGMKA